MKIDIIEVIKKEDGTSEVIFDYDDEFLKYVKLKTGKKRPSKKDISEIFLETLNEGLDMMKKEESND